MSRKIRLKLMAMDRELRAIRRLLDRMRDWSGPQAAGLIEKRLSIEKRRAAWMRRWWRAETRRIGPKKTARRSMRIIVPRIRNPPGVRRRPACPAGASQVGRSTQRKQRPVMAGDDQKIICGDARAELAKLPADSVHCAVTSPPYWGLRDYGCEGQIGLERSVGEFVEKLVAVFGELRRVLRNDGVLWLNMGDSYVSTACSLRTISAGGKNYDALDAEGGDGRKLNSERIKFGKEQRNGLKPKDLIGVPWRVALALQADGWWLRQDVIWSKPNPMPESVRDRCTRSHEYLFILTKRGRYWWDQDAIREAAVFGENRASFFGGTNRVREANVATGGYTPSDRGLSRPLTACRNKRSVWTIPTQAYPDAHFATFPEKLVEPCILASCPGKCCAACGAGWERVVERSGRPPVRYGVRNTNDDRNDNDRPNGPELAAWKAEHPDKTLGFEPTCKCGAAETVPGTVLDPFAGSGTAIAVAKRLGRQGIGIELSDEYCKLAEKRIAAVDRPLFAL